MKMVSCQKGASFAELHSSFAVRTLGSVVPVTALLVCVHNLVCVHGVISGHFFDDREGRETRPDTNIRKRAASVALS